MKKLYTISIAILFSSVIHAQDLKQYFVSMPDSVIPVLTKVNREDCIDFLESKMKAKVKNRFEKTSEMTKLTKDYIEMNTTGASAFEMKLLPVNDSVKVICMVNTYCGKACDSNLSFYDTSWNRLNNNDFITIPSKDYYLKSLQNKEDSIREIASTLNMSFRKIALSENNNDIVISYSTIDDLDENDRKKFEDDFKNLVTVFKWKDGKYILEEK